MLHRDFADWFVVWDTTTAGVRPLIDLLAERGLSVPALDPVGGDLSIAVLEDGIAAHGHILVLTDRPNANVGFELGHALGDPAKDVALIFTGRERPAWMQYPPLAGILSHSVRDPAAVMNLPDHAFMRGCGRALDGEDVLFLCPTGGVEGATLAFKAQELFHHWRVLPDGGWNVTTLPDQLEGISHVVWVLASHSQGADARDGSENTRNAVVAGFAERCGATLDVLVSESARTVVDVEARALRFATLEEFCARR